MQATRIISGIAIAALLLAVPPETNAQGRGRGGFSAGNGRVGISIGTGGYGYGGGYGRAYGGYGGYGYGGYGGNRYLSPGYFGNSGYVYPGGYRYGNSYSSGGYGGGYGNTYSGDYYDDASYQAVAPYQGPGVAIRNRSGEQLSFLLDDARLLKIETGETQRLMEKGQFVITFNRGGQFGDARYTIHEGLYEFTPTDHGWELYRQKTDNAQPAATGGNPDPTPRIDVLRPTIDKTVPSVDSIKDPSVSGVNPADLVPLPPAPSDR